jgi:TonB-linked SusC/RagA family outer membrane protein
MGRIVLMVLLGILLVAPRVVAQQQTITGTVTDERSAPLANVSVIVKGTSTTSWTGRDGSYSIRAVVGQVLQFRTIGRAQVERTVGAAAVIDVQLKQVAVSLDAVVVTALGQTTLQRATGSSQQSVPGSTIAETQRENFINALQGRIAGVDVTSTSGVPGASSSITIRGVSSISGSNQPLMIVDGLPLDNKTMNTGVLASEQSANTAMSNRGVDFTNRASDLNPDDIESVTVLKGPEAAALYGIDAANGAIVITTKRGRIGASSVEYSNSFEVASTGAHPQLQRVYGPALTGGVITAFSYFGNPYPAGTTFYDNIDGFFRTATAAHNNLAFSGASPDNRLSYRFETSTLQQDGVVPNSNYNRINLTGSSRAQVKDWLTADLLMTYAYDSNNQPWKGDDGPLIGLLAWPQNDNAKDYLSPAGTRRRLTLLTAGAEIDNPYFNVAKNQQQSHNNRLIANLGLTVAPFSWGYLKSNLGVDGYTNEEQILRHPESYLGNANGGILDVATDVTRNLSAQTLLNFNNHTLTSSGLSIYGLLGHAILDQKSSTDAADGTNFLDPSFVSINNTSIRLPLTTVAERRVVSLFGSATLDYRDLWYTTVTGRNDWSSTLPVQSRSFFYPSISSSFVLSDAVPSVGRFMTAKLRVAFAEAGKDAPPYSIYPSLQYKTTSYGGYGYNFWGPNPNLKPEFARSVEGGAELGFFHDRLGFDVTAYRKLTIDQIVQNIRGSYATGFILFNMNGGKTRSRGVEATLRATPIVKPKFSWDFSANFAASGSIVLSLPRALPESYVSDTWLYGNVRAGTMPGLSTLSLTGTFYLRNNQGQLLIDPTTGLPVRSTDFIDRGYDRQPDFTIGLANTLRYKKWTLEFLLDIRKGGDVFDATDHYLTTHGLSMQTLDRDKPRVIPGVLQDGKQNSANPTPNNIVVIPSAEPAYYTAMSEELFIERNINWLRLRDVQVSYDLPPGALRLLHAAYGSVFLKGTDLFLITNYTGLDPIVNGNTAAVGGSGGIGIDYGNFPTPRGFNLGVRVGF